MPFPKTRDGLRAAGYEFDNEAKCRGCGEDIEWWITPKDKKIPMHQVEENGESILVAHFTDCPMADHFRKNK